MVQISEKEELLKEIVNLVNRAKSLIKAEEKDGRIYPEREKEILDESLEVLKDAVNLNLAEKVGVPLESAKKINKPEKEIEETEPQAKDEVFERGWPDY